MNFLINSLLRLFGGGYSQHQIKLSEKQIADGWHVGVEHGYEYASGAIPGGMPRKYRG